MREHRRQRKRAIAPAFAPLPSLRPSFTFPMKRPLLALGVAALLAVAMPPALAQQDTAADVQQLRNTLLILIRTLLDQNLITVAKAQEMLRQAGIDPSQLVQSSSPPAPPAAAPAASAPPVVRVPYVPEPVQRQLREEIREEVLATARAERWAVPEALPAWLARLNFAGDVRLRLQHDAFADDNGLPDDVNAFYQTLDTNSLITNTNETRDRLRIR